jgi:hypothetical protein
LNSLCEIRRIDDGHAGAGWRRRGGADERQHHTEN